MVIVEKASFKIAVAEVVISKNAAGSVSVQLILEVTSIRTDVTVRGEEEYVPPTVAVATKDGVPLLEMPMAIQAVARDVIEDRQARTSLEAVKNVSGIQPSTYQFYDQFFIRGVDSGYGAIF